MFSRYYIHMTLTLQNNTNRLINFGVHCGDHVFFNPHETRTLSSGIVASISNVLETYVDSKMMTIVSLPESRKIVTDTITQSTIADDVTETRKRKTVKT